MNRFRRHTKKVLVGIVGGLVTLIGLILIPYPGPGWLIVFGGLAILATEFQFASRWLHFLREKYDDWVAWLKRQTIIIRTLVIAFTSAVVVITLWLLNTFGIIAGLFDLQIEWVRSPFFR